MKLIALIFAIVVFLLLLLLALVDPSFCTLRHITELLSLGLVAFATSFLPIP